MGGTRYETTDMAINLALQCVITTYSFLELHTSGYSCGW